MQQTMCKFNIEKNERSKLTLIIDGNWLLMSRISVISNGWNGNTYSMMQKLKQMMCKSINVMIRQIPEIDNIIFVSDGGSWRKQIEQPKIVREYHTDYKGQREKSGSIDWTIVFKEYSDFVNQLNEYSNVTVSHAPMVEGDDWCWWWSNALNDDMTNVIIWSADRDLTQLVKTDSNTGVFTITIYTRGKNTILTKQSNEVLENDYDIVKMFGNAYWPKNVKMLSNIEQIASDIKCINPNNVILDKIFRGDVSDNIFPSIKRKTKSGKEFRLNEKFVDEFNGNVKNDSDIKEFISYIYNKKQYKNKMSYTETDAIEHTMYNRQLVMMDEKYYPTEILNTIKEGASKYNKTKDISVTEQHIIANTSHGNEMEDFLNNV